MFIKSTAGDHDTTPQAFIESIEDHVEDGGQVGIVANTYNITVEFFALGDPSTATILQSDTPVGYVAKLRAAARGE